MEFAFGEWSYFALNKDNLCHGMAAFCCPSQGTLGRRVLNAMPDVANLRQVVWCQDMQSLPVARPDIEALRKKLEDRFQRHLDTSVYNVQNGLTFVRDDETYICCNNCNHAVAAWLRELGCEVVGCAFFSSFRVEPLNQEQNP